MKKLVRTYVMLLLVFFLNFEVRILVFIIACLTFSIMDFMLVLDVAKLWRLLF